MGTHHTHTFHSMSMLHAVLSIKNQHQLCKIDFGAPFRMMGFLYYVFCIPNVYKFTTKDFES